jgi:hypothetical protein
MKSCKGCLSKITKSCEIQRITKMTKRCPCVSCLVKVTCVSSCDAFNLFEYEWRKHVSVYFHNPHTKYRTAFKRDNPPT